MSWEDKIAEYEELEKKCKEGTGVAGRERQHKQGKKTARERIELLFDKETFVEQYAFMEGKGDNVAILGDGVVVGYGKVKGRIVFAISEDFTLNGGTLGEVHALKICKTIAMAIKVRAPIVLINDSGGARVQEGINALSGYANVFKEIIAASGIIPLIALVLGPCAGGASYGPALCDFIFVVEDISKMFVTGPNVVKAVTGEVTSAVELGGAHVHSQETGIAHFCYKSEEECFKGVRHLLSYFEKEIDYEVGVMEKFSKNRRSLMQIVPENTRKPYDMHEVIEAICDKTSFFEVQKRYAENAIIGFGRIEGKCIGIIANQPCIKGGALDCDASVKIARFIRFCDCHNIPLVTLVDVPAFYPGCKQEHKGIIKHGAKIIYAYSEATVPKITIVLRKAYGGAYIAMDSMHLGADFVYAWPIAEIAVMGGEGAAEIIYKKQISESATPELERKRLIEEYKVKNENPYIAAKMGYVSEVIHPDLTREKVLSSLKVLEDKNNSENMVKKHGNIPL